MTIRRANSRDAVLLARLYDTVWSQEIEILGERLAAERRADETTIKTWLENDSYFVVEVDGCIAAALGCEKRHGTLHLVHLVTRPDYRKRGYAEALMKRAEAYGSEIGANKIWFDSSPDLNAAHSLYVKLGYQKCGRLTAHYWGTDIVLYEKML